MAYFIQHDIKATNGWQTKKCAICGHPFKCGEELKLLVFSNEVKAKYSKLDKNLVCHADEYMKLCAWLSEGEVVKKLASVKTPRVKRELTKSQLAHIEAFRQAADTYGLFVETDALKREGVIKRRYEGNSLTVEYNPYTDKLDVTHRRKSGLMGDMYKRNTIASIYNAMHGILNDGKRDDFNLKAVMEEVIDEVNKNI